MHLRMFKRFVIVFLVCNWPFVAGAASGDELEEGPISEVPDVEVIQNRKYDLFHEVALLGGGLPVDPYYKGVTGSAGYTLHFAQSVAWEIIQFTYSFNFDTDLKKQIVAISSVSGNGTPQFPEIQWIAATHLVLKPLYGKEALFNTKVEHLEVYLQAGPALVNRKEATTPLSFGVDAGFGLRLWLTRVISFRLDFGELVYFAKEGANQVTRQALHLHAGFAFNLTGGD